MPAIQARSLPDGDGETCTREPSYTREPSCISLPLPSSYPGTVVEAWHPRDALVPLFSFLQKESRMGRLALGTVTTDALIGKTGKAEGPRSEMGRKSLLGGCPHRMQGPGTLPSSPSPSHSLSPATSLQQLRSVLKGPGWSQQLALSLLQEEAQVGPSQRAFQTGVWEEAEGPAEGPSVPPVPATCTRGEDKPQGSRMKKLAPSASASAWGCPETAAGGAGPLWRLLGRACSSTTVTGSTGPWV